MKKKHQKNRSSVNKQFFVPFWLHKSFQCLIKIRLSIERHRATIYVRITRSTKLPIALNHRKNHSKACSTGWQAVLEIWVSLNQPGAIGIFDETYFQSAEYAASDLAQTYSTESGRLKLRFTTGTETRLEYDSRAAELLPRWKFRAMNPSLRSDELGKIYGMVRWKFFFCFSTRMKNDRRQGV